MKTLTIILAILATVFAGVDSLTYINSARVDHGLPAVQHSESLTAQANAHAREMAEANDLYHSGLETGAAEIVGRGASVELIHKAFMASPAHRAALLGDFSHAGAGMAQSSTGVLYVAVVFDGIATPATTTTTTSTTTTLPTPQADPAPTTVAPPICPTANLTICLE